MVQRPEGATVPGTFEWYRGPAPDAHAVTLGVFRPPSATRVELSITVIILPGGDGLRRLYEELAQRFATAGFIAVLGSWYEHDESSCPLDAIHCPNAPVWKGMNAAAVRDVDAVVAAVGRIPGVDPNRVVLFGHSYGGGVALLRAANGSPELVVSSAGLNSRTGYRGTPLATDEFPSDVASLIRAPVLVIQGRYDGITPFEMAETLIAAMPPDNPADTIFYPAPANHGYPWQSEAFPDRPGVPMSLRLVEDVGAWARAQFPS
jgi:dienelactone hydrolase